MDSWIHPLSFVALPLLALTYPPPFSYVCPFLLQASLLWSRGPSPPPETVHVARRQDRTSAHRRITRRCITHTPTLSPTLSPHLTPPISATVESPEGVWHCEGKESRCRHSDPIKLDLEVVSLTPRAFIIPNFLSDYEADSIVKQASPHIATSSVGDADVGIQNSDTRTSKNTWLNRYSSLITQSIFLRAGE